MCIRHLLNQTLIRKAAADTMHRFYCCSLRRTWRRRQQQSSRRQSSQWSGRGDLSAGLSADAGSQHLCSSGQQRSRRRRAERSSGEQKRSIDSSRGCDSGLYLGVPQSALSHHLYHHYLPTFVADDHLGSPACTAGLGLGDFVQQGRLISIASWLAFHGVCRRAVIIRIFATV